MQVTGALTGGFESVPNATQKSPLAAWGQPLLVAGPGHLAHFDAYRAKILRVPRLLFLAGMLLALSGMAFIRVANSANLPPGALGLFGVGSIVGILLAFAGGWVLFRFSFAAHRMWGLYENGFVAPLYVQGGFEPFVPWSGVKFFKLRRMRSDDPKAIVPGELFLFRSDDPRGYHRIWETALRDVFGYDAAQLGTLKEEILTIARARLPADKVVVEQELADQ